MVGAGTGAAATGLIPIIDLMMSSFIYVAADQLFNNLAKLRYMMGGAATFPLTILASTGSPGAIGAQHSDAPYAHVIHAGGIKVVVPTTPTDAKGLITSAIRDPDPVMVLFPMALGAVSGDVPAGEHLVPLGRGCVVREGDDVTIVAIGAMVRRAVDAATELESEGVSAEVIDPRTLHPFDYPIVLESVAKTGRLLCVDEAKRSCSVASEIVARVCVDGFDTLREAPRILANPDIHIPYAPILEEQLMPRTDQIVSTVCDLVPQAARS